MPPEYFKDMASPRREAPLGNEGFAEVNTGIRSFFILQIQMIIKPIAKIVIYDYYYKY